MTEATPVPPIARVEPGRVLVKPISQAAFRLETQGKAGIFESVVDTALRWAQSRAGRPLPDAAIDRKQFETSEIGAQHVSAVIIENPRIWALRVDDADKEVALRTWVTDVCVGIDPMGAVLVGVRLICTMRGEILPVDRTVPSFVRTIIELGGVELDGRPITTGPWVVVDEKDVDDLVDLLEDRKRAHSVVVLSSSASEDGSATTAIAAEALIHRVCGAAHVVVLSEGASRMLTDRVGREMSVFRKAVRVYKPGFHRVTDNPWRHLLYSAKRVSEWPGSTNGEFISWLASRAVEDTVQGPARREELVPSFNTVRQAAALAEREKSKSEGASADELIKLFEADNDCLRFELQTKLTEFNSLLEESEKERSEAMDEARAAKAQVAAMRSRIQVLERRLNESNVIADPIPNSLDSFEAWCQENLAGSIEVHSRALNSVKKSVYRDNSLIYRALLLLRDRYIPMRREGGMHLVSAFEAECLNLSIENSPVGEAAKRYQDEYTVRWNGEPHVLDWHLKSGDARERTKCFRLYYCWIEESQCVLVGSMPAHLRNDLT